MAALAGTINGNYLGIFVDGTLIACMTSATLDMQTSMSDATCKLGDGTAPEQVTPSQNSWSVSGDGNLAFDASYGFVDLQTVWSAQTKVVIRFTTVVDATNPNEGDPYYEGDAYIESLSCTGPMNETATWSVSFKGSGLLTTGTNPVVP